MPESSDKDRHATSNHYRYGLQQSPGEVARGGISIIGDMYGRPREIPIIVYRGVEEGPILWLNGATHGDEPEGPFSIFKALAQLGRQRIARHGRRRTR